MQEPTKIRIFRLFFLDYVPHKDILQFDKTAGFYCKVNSSSLIAKTSRSSKTKQSHYNVNLLAENLNIDGKVC